MPQMTDNPRLFERPIQFGGVEAAGMGGTAILIGGGTTSQPIVATKAQSFIDLRTETQASSGDIRMAYLRLYVNGPQYGDCVRAFTKIKGTGVQGTSGVHATVGITATGAVSGMGVGLRATLEADAASRTLTGTLAALQVDSYVGANNTLPASCSFIRVADVGSVKIANLFEIATDGCLKGSACGTSGQDAIKIRVNGVTRYIALFNAS